MPNSTAQTVNTAIRWYRAQADAISQALPLTTPGVTFGKAWPASTLEKQIEMWESGTLSLPLAAAYIVNPLRIIKGALIQKG